MKKINRILKKHRKGNLFFKKAFSSQIIFDINFYEKRGINKNKEINKQILGPAYNMNNKYIKYVINKKNHLNQMLLTLYQIPAPKL